MARVPTPPRAAQSSDADAQTADEAKAKADAAEKAKADAEAKAKAAAEANAIEAETVEVRILRDQAQYRCGEVATLPLDVARVAVKDGWGDPTEEAVAQGYAEAE